MSKPNSAGFFRTRKKQKRGLQLKMARCLGSQAVASGSFKLKTNATTIATAPMKYGLDMPRY